jgi:uncharacterized membrane protein
MRIPKWITIGLLSISAAGFLDASYLAFKFYTGTVPPCSLLKGCEVVTTSQYATVGGVSIALIGALYYLAVFLAVIFYFDTNNEKALYIIPPLAGAGFLISLYLVYLQFFVLEAVCVYCMFSALTSALLFVFGTFLFSALQGTSKKSENVSGRDESR